MAVNTTPAFTDTPVATVGQVSTANTNRNGTGTVATIYSAGADGSRIDLIRVVATGTTTAGVVRIFIHDGTNFRLYKEILVTAITPSTTIEVFVAEFRPSVPLLLPTGYSIRASTHNAETFNIHISGSEF